MSKVEQAALKKAIVKQVLSGDTIVVRAQPRGGPPPEKQISLSGVTSPRLARKTAQDDTKDEPWAWESREFVRKLLVGKEIFFSLEEAPNTTRIYGKIFLDKDGKNSVTELLVSEGLVTVRKENKNSPDVTHLTELEETAKSNKKGMWSGDNKEDHIRSITWAVANPAEFLQQYKGKTVQAIVEHVRDGSTVRVLLLPSFTYVTLMLSGIRCPSFKLDSTGRPDESVIVPYALEARFFTESRLLNQDVDIVLESVSNTSFVGALNHPKGNIAEALVREGFAKCVDWSLNSCSAELVEKLRIAEKTAKQAKLRLWESYQVPQVQVDVKEKEFSGIVVEVFNGDWLNVKCANNEVKKVFLSSIRSPKDAKPEEEKKVVKNARPLYEVPWLWECREFLRKKLLNKKVTCKLDYITPSKDSMPERRSYTVLLSGANIAEQLVAKGLATVIRYRQDNDQRSSFYNELLLAEATAAKELVGLHGKKETPSIRLCDLTVDTSKIRHQYLPSWQRALRIDAIIEFVASGSRFRIYIPRENCLVNFLLGGIYCPRSSRPALNGLAAVEGEAFGDEALNFVKNKIFQRDVSVQIESADKAFAAVIGWLFTENKVNLSVALLEEGLAKIHPPSAEKSEYYRLLKNAEEKAKAARLNIWKDWKEVEETTAEQGVDAEAEIDQKDTTTEKAEEVVIIEVLRDLSFYAQKTADTERLNKLMENVKTSLDSMASGVFRPRRGDIVAAKFSLDNQWYRAKIEKVVQSRANILYIDYGNREVVDVSTLKELPSTLKAEKPYAHEYKLALLMPPKDEDDLNETYNTFGSDVLDKKLNVSVQYRLQGVPYVILKSGDGKVDIGRELVNDGFVLVEKRKEDRLQKLLTEYKEAEETARKAHLGIWRYGDITDDVANEFGLRSN